MSSSVEPASLGPAPADSELSRLSRISREEALEKLMVTYGDRVLHLAYFYLKDRQLAEDVAQEVFVRVFRTWDRFRGDCSVSTWICTITTNLCRDRLRSPWWKRIVLGWDFRENCESGDAEAEALEAIKRQSVYQAVLTLPVQYREVIALFYYQGMTAGEIGALLKESQGTIKSRLHRARALLKDRIGFEAREEVEGL